MVLASDDSIYSMPGRAKLDYPNHLDEFIGSVQIPSAIISGIIAAIALLFIQPVSHILDLSPFLVCLLVIYLFFTPTITFYHDAYRYRSDNPSDFESEAI